MAKQKQSFDLMDYDCDLGHRVLSLGSQRVSAGNESGVDASLADRAVKGLFLLDTAAPDGDKPINILLNNPGGDVYHCLAIYDAIAACKNKTIITVFGMAMSAGSILMQAADYRRMTPHSTLMIHDGEGGGYGHPNQVDKWYKEGKRLDKIVHEIYLHRIREKNPEFTLKKLRKLLTFDTFLNPKQALQLGLIDEAL